MEIVHTITPTSIRPIDRSRHSSTSGAHDHRIALAIEEAADTGEPVVTAPEEWSTR